MKRLRRRVRPLGQLVKLCCALLAASSMLMSATSASDDVALPTDAAPIRGVTVSCFRNGPGEWDGPDMPATLDDLVGLGANWVTIHPYARVSRDGALRWSERDRDTVAATTKLAHERGLRVMIKPHLAYWGSGFAWRGVITFPEAEAQERFWSDYERWLDHHADLAAAHGVDLLCVGTELRLMSGEAFAPQWRRIIDRVRERYNGPLTYAANWDEYTAVPFWDELDYVGVQAYFPLVRDADGAPDDRALRAGWQRVTNELAAAARKHGRPILLTELGYAGSTAAAAQPWSWEVIGDADEAAALKLRCMSVALDAIAKQPAIEGVFLWKWFPSPREIDREFVLQYPAMEEVIRSKWR